MSQTITGTANLIKLYPQSFTTNPTHTNTPPSSSAAAILSDSSDATYLEQTAENAYFRAKCGAAALPAGARVMYARAVTRAWHTTPTTTDWLVFLGDSTGRNGAEVDNLPSTHLSLAADVQEVASPARQVLANGRPIDQDAISKGLWACFGKNTSVASAAVFRVSAAYVEVAYDAAPTATITSPVGTVGDTSSPLVQWDYFDDLQPQAKYQLNVQNADGLVVYDSGLLVSSETAHQVTTHLPAGDYTVNLRVYQAWNGPGGDFRANTLATAEFTVAALPLPVPSVHQTTQPLTANLLTGDDATFAASVGAWLTTTPAGAAVTDGGVRRAGLGSLRVPLQTGHLTYTRTLDTVDLVACPVKFTGWVKAALSDTSATVQITAAVKYYSSSGTYLGGSPAVPVTLANSDTWQPVVVAAAVFPPLNATQATVDFALAAPNGTGDLYLTGPALTLDDGSTDPTVPLDRPDQVAVTAYVASDVNLLTYDDSTFDNGPAGWQKTTGASIDVTSLVVLMGTKSGALTLAASSGSVALPDGAYIAPSDGYQFTPGAFVYVRSPLAGKTARLDILAQTWSGSAWTSHVFQGPTITLAANGWTRVPVLASQSNAPFGQFLTLKLTVTGSSGNVFYIDNAYLGTDRGSLNDWSRGGVTSDGLNLLTYNDSAMGAPNDWIGNNANTTVTGSTDHVLYGTAALKATRTGTAGDIDVRLGNGVFLPIDQTQRYAVIGSIYSPATARTFRITYVWFDASFTQISSASVSVSSAVGKWTPLAANLDPSTAFPTGKYLTISLYVVGAATNEVHYFDGVSIAEFGDATPLGWRPGLPPDTDVAPTVLLEKSDSDYPTYRPVGRVQLHDATGRYQPVAIFPDYEIKSSKPRTYRASLSETVNDLYLQSTYSAPLEQTVTLPQVWMHARSDVAGTLAHFLYDGAGRSDQVGVVSTATEVEGREFPFAEFAAQSNGQIQVTLQLASAEDEAALRALAKARAEVVFRDQRGRGLSGTIGPVQFADATWGSTGSFTLTLSGDQP